jgi:hypothetical protein
VGPTKLEHDERFTVAERASISLLFDRLERDGITPLMLYCVDRHGYPLAVFATPFTPEVNEALGEAVTGAMQFAQMTLTQ